MLFKLNMLGLRKFIEMHFNTNLNASGFRCYKPVNGLEEFWDNLSQNSIMILGSYYEENISEVNSKDGAKLWHSPDIFEFEFQESEEEKAFYFQLKFGEYCVSS